MSEQKTNKEVSDAELKKVIADFLEMGHVENIIAMFMQEPRYYEWTGDLLRDERFAVRLGMSVLFEELKAQQSEELHRAEHSLITALASEQSWVRGEALSVLAIIGSEAALAQVRRHLDDPAPEVAEVAKDILEDA